MQLSVSQVAALLGISIGTLRRWDKDGYLKPSFRTMGGHRRYDLHYLEERFFDKKPSLEKSACRALAYCRVSSSNQKVDLATQVRKLSLYCQQHFANFEVIEDLGSGLNYKKPGLRKLFRLIFQQQITHLVINHKDRLLRFGSEIIFDLCEHFGIKVIIIEAAPSKNFEEELAADVIELMTVFSSRLYGRRSQQNRKKAVA